MNTASALVRPVRLAVAAQVRPVPQPGVLVGDRRQRGGDFGTLQRREAIACPAPPRPC